MTSYQKLKQELAKVKANLQEVVLRPGSIESAVIKTSIKWADKTERLYWFGSFENLSNSLLNQSISKESQANIVIDGRSYPV